DRGFVGDRTGRDNGFAAGSTDLLGHGLGLSAADVVDHHARALARKVKRVLAAKSTARTRDNCYTPVQRHGRPPVSWKWMHGNARRLNRPRRLPVACGWR